MAYDPNRYLAPELRNSMGRGAVGRGGPTWFGAAPNVRGPAAPAGGTRLGSLPRQMPAWSPVVTMAPGRYGFAPDNGDRISARPSARNSAEYYANRDFMTGNPLDNLELTNRNKMAAAMQIRGQANDPRLGPLTSGPSTFNAATGQWEQRSQPTSQTIADIEAGRVAARAEEEDAAALMADARAQELEDRRMNAYLRSGGRAQVTDEMDVPTTIEGLPADLYWQREANRGRASNVRPLPGFQGVPFTPTAAGARYLDRLTGSYKRGIR